MTDCTQVPTLDEIYQAKKNITDLDTFANSTADTFVDSDGVTKATLNGMINNFGFGIADFTFTDGGTLLDRKLLVSNYPVDGFLYRYVGTGTGSIVVTAGTDPTMGADWGAFTATSAEFISNANGGSVQDFIDNTTAETAFVIPQVDTTGVIDESTKILALLNAGKVVKLPSGKIRLNIVIPDGAVLLGSGNPRFDDTVVNDWDAFGTAILGDINVSDKLSWAVGNLSIDNFDAGGNAIAGIGPRTGFGYIKNVNTRANNHGHLYETACSNPLAGYDASSGVVGNIVVEDCEHWGGPNGYVSKHHRVKFIRCKSWGVTVQGLVAVSDNINAATTYNRATETLFEDCYSEGLGLGVGGPEGIRIYTQDRFSADPVNDVNTNNVQPVDTTYIVRYKSQLMGGSSIRLGDVPNPSVCELPSTNTFIDGWKYATFAFSGITLHHSHRTIISRSEFGAGANVSVQPQASGVIIDDTNIMLGGNIQTGAEVGRILVNNNSNSIENRFWTQGLTYRFQNTSPTTINSVIFSIYNKPIRLVIDDVFTEIGLFGGGVTYKGKGTVIEAMFNGSEWIVLNNGTIKSINEQSIAYAASINFDYLNANSNNLSVLLGGDLTTINATIEGMPYGSTVGLFMENAAGTKNLSGWGLMWRFEGSIDVNQLGNAPTSLAPYTKLYIEFYVRNGLLIEKSRSFYV